jgi:hypothetical protein
MAVWNSTDTPLSPRNEERERWKIAARLICSLLHQKNQK